MGTGESKMNDDLVLEEEDGGYLSARCWMRWDLL